MEGANSRGFIYVATGIKYVKEAREAASYLRRFHTEPICLITDRFYYEVEKFWDDIVILQEPTYSLKDKTYISLAPYKKCIFLDTDTYVTTNLEELFQLLDAFDLAAQQLFEGHEYEMEGVPHSFSEFNSGVIVFNNHEAFFDFCSNWRKLYDYYLKDTINDQRSFRKVVYQSKLRIATLTPEYNFRPLTTNFAIQKLKIIHGRTFPLLKKLEQKMNSKATHRAYVPVFDAVISDYMEISELWKVWKRASLYLIKEIGKKITNKEFRNKIRENKIVRYLFLKNDFHEWMRK